MSTQLGAAGQSTLGAFVESQLHARGSPSPALQATVQVGVFNWCGDGQGGNVIQFWDGARLLAQGTTRPSITGEYTYPNVEELLYGEWNPVTQRYGFPFGVPIPSLGTYLCRCLPRDGRMIVAGTESEKEVTLGIGIATVNFQLDRQDAATGAVLQIRGMVNDSSWTLWERFNGDYAMAVLPTGRRSGMRGEGPDIYHHALYPTFYYTPVGVLRYYASGTPAQCRWHLDWGVMPMGIGPAAGVWTAIGPATYSPYGTYTVIEAALWAQVFMGKQFSVVAP